MQKGGEVVDSTSVDRDIAEAEGGSEGGLQEQEVHATWSASQEDQSHPQTPHQTPGTNPQILWIIDSSNLWFLSCFTVNSMLIWTLLAANADKSAVDVTYRKHCILHPFGAGLSFLAPGELGIWVIYIFSDKF